MRRSIIMTTGLGALAVLLAACGSSSSTTTTTQAPTSTTQKAAATGSAPATGAQTLAAKLTGIGTTVVHMKALHGRDEIAGGLCSSGPVCFGSPVKNEEDDKYQFTAALVSDGIVTGYTQAFPTGTSTATAQSEIMRWMPSDATAGPLTVVNTNGSCAMYDITSPTLATIFAAHPSIGDSSGVLGVELSYTDANGNITYDPNNVESASISVSPSDPSGGC
jgi:hypothetical protein